MKPEAEGLSKLTKLHAKIKKPLFKSAQKNKKASLFTKYSYIFFHKGIDIISSMCYTVLNKAKEREIMQLNEILRQIMEEKNQTQTTFASSVGTTQSAIGNALKRNDLYVSTLVKWCETNGYEVIVQERKSGKRREGQMVLSQKEG